MVEWDGDGQVSRDPRPACFAPGGCETPSYDGPCPCEYKYEHECEYGTHRPENKYEYEYEYSGGRALRDDDGDGRQHGLGQRVDVCVARMVQEEVRGGQKAIFGGRKLALALALALALECECECDVGDKR